jgi:hypothetical protein
MILKEFNDPFYYHIKTQTETKRKEKTEKKNRKGKTEKKKEKQGISRYYNFYKILFILYISFLC